MDKEPLKPSNVPTKIRLNNQNTLGKVQKCNFRPFKLAANSQGKGHLRSNSRKGCPLPLALSLPRFVRITEIHWEKSAKMWFQTLKMAIISPGSWSFEVKFRDKVPLTPSNAPAKFHWNKTWQHILDSAAAVSMPSKTYRSHTSCGT